MVPKKIRLFSSGEMLLVLAYSIWGLLPLFWYQLRKLPTDLVVHLRVWEGAVILGGFWFLLTQTRLGTEMSYKSLRLNKFQILLLALAGTFLVLNWWYYVYLVNSGQVLAASLGYFMNPLLTVFLGYFFLKERLSPYQIVGCVLAILGLFVYGFASRKSHNLEFSFVDTFILMGTFAGYGFFKKVAGVPAFQGVFVEFLFMGLLSILYFWFGPFIFGPSSALSIQNVIHSVSSLRPVEILAALGAGVVTVVPTLLFSAGLRKMSMAQLGFLQYISPSLKFFLGVFFFAEPFGSLQFAGFALVWMALFIVLFEKRVLDRGRR